MKMINIKRLLIIDIILYIVSIPVIVLFLKGNTDLGLPAGMLYGLASAYSGLCLGLTRSSKEKDTN